MSRGGLEDRSLPLTGKKPTVPIQTRFATVTHVSGDVEERVVVILDRVLLVVIIIHCHGFGFLDRRYTRWRDTNIFANLVFCFHRLRKTRPRTGIL